MQRNDILDQIINSDQSFSLQQLVDIILPVKQNGIYSINDIDKDLRSIYQGIEQTQREHNDKFDARLDEPVQDKLKNLCQDLNKIQLDVLNLQNDIAQAKERYNIVYKSCNSELIEQHRQTLIEQINIKKSLQQSKFQSIKEYFTAFINHLTCSINSSKKIMAQHALMYLQSFDWAHYHQAMYILRACGKTRLDIEKFERLYQSNCLSFANISLKQPLKNMDLSHFIEFHATYSLETQAEINFDQQQQTQSGCHKCDFGEFLAKENIRAVLESEEPITYEIFSSQLDHLQSATIACCRILIDMNLNYIEAHFTDGINIEKLNGCDIITQQTVTSSSEQALPSYAFSPQEYITQIGQHLLTLKKQTDKIGQLEGQPLRLALKSLEQAQDIALDLESCESVTAIMLKCISRHCIRSLVARTTQSILSKLTSNGRRQLATDVMYLDNVLEDLNLLGSSEPNVKKFKSLIISQ